MKITIKNIGIIQEAALNLNGFTVLAGENDSGKSTVGKVVYALTQACTNYPLYRKEVVARNVRQKMRIITQEIRRNFDLTKHEILKPFTSFGFVQNLINNVDGGLYEIRSMLDELEDFYPEKRLVITHLKSRLNSVQREIELSINENLVFNYISHVMESEFGGEIGGKLDQVDSAIEIVDGETKVLEVRFQNGFISHGMYTGDIGYSDATFIDGTSVLQYASGASSLIAENHLPFHVVDLSKKLTTQGFARGVAGDSLSLNSVYKGRLLFDEERNGFVLDKGGRKVCLGNIASGIKNLGIIDMLIKNGVICDGSLLVLDEPETNLHPKWQVELARLICELRKVGVNLLITTHSPYMVQALNHFADEFNIDANFYLTCRDMIVEDRVDFVDMTGDVGKIIEALAKPLWDIIEGHDDF